MLNETPPNARFAVLGNPISHSLSPLIHRAAFDATGFRASYTALQTSEEQFRERIATPGFDGYSVTMPLKRLAAQCAASGDGLVRETGVANTLVRVSEPQQPPTFRAFNTDVHGLRFALQEALAALPPGLAHSTPERALVLGAGATALSALLALGLLGVQRVTIAARRLEAARALVPHGEAVGVAVSVASLSALPGRSIDGVDAVPALAELPALCVNTVPGPHTAEIALPDACTSGALLYDVAYDPWPTPLARRWLAGGGAVQSGITMLREQAVIQQRAFRTGTVAEVPRDVCDEHVLRSAMNVALSDSGFAAALVPAFPGMPTPASRPQSNR